MGKKGSDMLQYGLMIIGIAGGWLGYSYINQFSDQVGWGFSRVLGVILITVAAVAIGIFLNIVLHEAGHLIGGLLTGYRFAAFCVFKLTIMKDNGKLAVKKCGVPGTSGFCVTSPPDMKNGTYPHKLYISSGFLVNFLVSAGSFGLFCYLAGTASSWARAFLVIGIVGAFLGLVNFVPTNAGGAFSDGYALFNMKKEKNAGARRGCWSLFRVYTLDTQGVRPRDIPAELFDWADTSDIRDIFVLAAALNQYKYLLDRQEMDKAAALMRALCADLHSVFETQKRSCYCNLLFHELIGECQQEELARLFTRELRAYMEAARSDFCVQRIMYAYARLALKDAAIAKECLDSFHKTCASSIWSGTAIAERELIALVDTIAGERENTIE